MKSTVFFKKEHLIPLILLLLAFPPVLRSEILTVQKVQLVLFLIAGAVFALRNYRDDRRITIVLFLLFAAFPAVYAGSGFFHGYPPYTIGKELLFFTMPFFMYMVFRKICISGKWVRVIVWFAVVVAISQILVFLMVLLSGPFMERNLYRWECLYISCPIFLLALWIIVGEELFTGSQKWGLITVLVLGILSTLGKRDMIGAGALLVFSIIGFFRSSKRMGRWILLLSVVPLLYLLLLNHALQLPGKSYRAWRVYEVQTFISTCGSGHAAFWTGNGLGWELPVSRTLHVHASDTLWEINKFHDFWLYLLSKAGVVGTGLFWLGLLSLFLLINRNLSRRFPRFLLGYLAFLCFVAWNYNGGPSMAFQQGALLGLVLALIQSDKDDSVLEEETR